MWYNRIMPQVMADAKKENTSFRLDPELIQRVDRMAELERRNRTNMVEVVLLDALARYEKEHSLPPLPKPRPAR